MFNFTALIAKHSKPMTVVEETSGFYDHTDGGKWKATTQTREVTAAAFNLSSRDIRGYGLNFGEGGTYTTLDIKIYIHVPLAIGSTVTWKGNPFTVTAEVDHSDHAKGLRFYVARRAGKIQNAPLAESEE